MSDDLHVPAAEGARWPLANHVALGCIVKHGIGTAVRLERTVGTAGEGFDDRSFHERCYPLSVKDVCVAVSVNIAEAKAAISHLSEHSGLVRGINIAVIVVDDDRDASACRRLQVNESRWERCEDFGKQDFRIGLGDVYSLSVQIDDVGEAVLVEVQKTLCFIARLCVGPGCKSVRADRAEKDGVESQPYILIDDFLWVIER